MAYVHMVDCLCMEKIEKECRQYLVLREWVTINSFYIIAIWYYMVNKKIRNIRADYIRNRNIVVKFRETGHQDGSVGKVHAAKIDDLSLILEINMMELEKWLPRVVFWSPHLCHGIDVFTQIRHIYTDREKERYLIIKKRTQRKNRVLNLGEAMGMNTSYQHGIKMNEHKLREIIKLWSYDLAWAPYGPEES